MIGQVRFFIPEKFWGILTSTDGRDIFCHGSEFQNGVEPPVRDQWVEFLEGTRHGKAQATSIVLIECPPEFQCRGIVTRFDPDKKFGFIKYEKREIFFHVSDVLLIEGVEYFPVKGCTVEFYVGQKTNKPLAVNVKIVGWPPEYKQTIEEYVLSAEPDHLEPQPEPARVEPQSKLLKPESRKKTLLELIQQRKK